MLEAVGKVHNPLFTQRVVPEVYVQQVRRPLHDPLHSFKRGQLVACKLKAPQVAQPTKGPEALVLQHMCKVAAMVANMC